MVSEYDEVLVQSLPERYGIGKTNFYGADGRLTKAGIKTYTRGRKAYITRHQLDYLDKLDAFVKGGGSINEFVHQFGVYQSNETSEQEGEQETEQPGELMRMTDAQLITDMVSEPQLVEVLEAIAQALHPPVPPLFAALEKLEQAYEKGWLLPTGAIAGLLGITGKSLVRHQVYEDLGFKATKVKSGGKVRWKVEKVKK